MVSQPYIAAACARASGVFGAELGVACVEEADAGIVIVVTAVGSLAVVAGRDVKLAAGVEVVILAVGCWVIMVVKSADVRGLVAVAKSVMDVERFSSSSLSGPGSGSGSYKSSMQ